ncbi:MAG: type II toxin-antitoxin system RelE/ParE family toxin [Bryobacteraceae bacterium]
MSGYVLHPEAYTDLDDIWEFIAEDNPNAADRVREDIYKAIGKLAPFPRQGRRRPDLTSRPLRFITVRDYLVAYAPDESPLLVIAVLHGRRSPRIMAAILRGRE